MGKKTAGGFYAVGKGYKTGIFNTWTECEANVKGFPDAKYKKFATEVEAQAFVQHWSSGAFNQPRTKTAAPSSTRSVHASVPCQKKRSHADVASTPPPAAKKPRSTQLIDTPLSNFMSKQLRIESPIVNGAANAETEVTFLPFIVDADDFVNVYTDGSCLQNGRSNPKAGVGVWFGDDHPLNVSKPVDGPPTNNTAEIQAARLAVQIAKDAGFPKLKINTDSAFLIQCMTSWMHKWKANGWKLATGGDVKNRIELEKLDAAMNGILVQWAKVPAHTGVHGNEMADRLASEGAAKYR